MKRCIRCHASYSYRLWNIKMFVLSFLAFYDVCENCIQDFEDWIME